MTNGPAFRSISTHCTRLAILLAAIFFALLIAAVACGGSASPGVATVPTATATPTLSVSPGSSATRSSSSSLAFEVSPAVSLTPGPAAYSACMRAHGVSNFPELANFGTNFKLQMQGSGIDPRSPTFQAASESCKSLFVPPSTGPGGGPTITSAEQTDYLQAAACMRTHGVPGFPDPVFSNGGVTFNIPSSISQSSSIVQSAIETCQKLIPAGLPYSGTN